MLTIQLANAQTRTFDGPLTVAAVTAEISPSLAKSALAARVDDDLVDLSYLLTRDAKLLIITERDPLGLEVIRHSAAHLLAQAVKLLFPSAQVTIGPVIEDGFFYDFAFERPFTPDDLQQIEIKMHALVKQNLTITRRELDRTAAIDYFRNLGESYKAEIIADIPATEVLSLYRQGDFEDLCRGPHVPSTGRRYNH